MVILPSMPKNPKAAHLGILTVDFCRILKSKVTNCNYLIPFETTPHVPFVNKTTVTHWKSRIYVGFFPEFLVICMLNYTYSNN